MTVPATTRKAGPFNGNGSNTSFPFTFKVFSTADVEVITAGADGAETLRVLDSDFSVTLNPDQDASPGGAITYPVSGSPLATGETLVATGDLEYSQETDIPTGGDFDPGVMEDALDRLTMQVQQLKEQLSRAVKVQVTSSTSPDDLVDELVTAGAGAENAWDAFRSQYYGSATSDPATDPLGNPPTAGDLYYNTANTLLRIYNGATWADPTTTVSTPYQLFSGNGVLTAFTLSGAPGSLGSLEAFISGVRQRPTTDYTLSGTTLTFTSAPPNAANNIFVRWIATTSIGVPSDGTVTTIKVADAAITLAKIATAVYGTSGANKLLQLDATGKLPALDGSQLTGLAAGFGNITAITTIGASTWTVPAGVTRAKVTLVGGGGGGSGGASTHLTPSTNFNNAGGGGGGGSHIRVGYVTGLTPGAGVTVTVGAGGSGTSGASGTDTTVSSSTAPAGGSSSFGAYLVAGGGAGGGGATTYGTPGAVAGAGGAAGAASGSAGSTGLPYQLVGATSGAALASTFTHAAAGAGGYNTLNTYGAGGAGGMGVSSTPNAGLAGSQGFVIIEY